MPWSGYIRERTEGRKPNQSKIKCQRKKVVDNEGQEAGMYFSLEIEEPVLIAWLILRNTLISEYRFSVGHSEL